MAPSRPSLQHPRLADSVHQAPRCLRQRSPIRGGAPGTEATAGPASRGAPQINHRMPERAVAPASPARRAFDGTPSRRVASRRFRPGRPSLLPQIGTSIRVPAVAHPSRTPPIPSIPRRILSTNLHCTINFGGEHVYSSGQMTTRDDDDSRDETLRSSLSLSLAACVQCSWGRQGLTEGVTSRRRPPSCSLQSPT